MGSEKSKRPRRAGRRLGSRALTACKRYFWRYTEAVSTVIDLESMYHIKRGPSASKLLWEEFRADEENVNDTCGGARKDAEFQGCNTCHCAS